MQRHTGSPDRMKLEQIAQASADLDLGSQFFRRMTSVDVVDEMILQDKVFIAVDESGTIYHTSGAELYSTLPHMMILLTAFSNNISQNEPNFKIHVITTLLKTWICPAQ